MRAYDPSKTLISIHVPKCAGISLLDVLNTWFGTRLPARWSIASRWFPWLQLRERTRDPWFQPKVKIRLRFLNRWFQPRFHLHYAVYGTPPRHSLEQPDACIHGHFNRNRGLGLEHYYPEASQFITILRDPLEVAVSTYFYRKRRGSVGSSDHRRSIDDFLRHHQPQMLLHLPRDLTLDNYEQILKERFVYIGLAEDLQTSVDRLARKLGKPTIAVPSKNKTSRTETPSEEAKAAFRERARLEYAIYEFARARYARVEEPLPPGKVQRFV